MCSAAPLSAGGRRGQPRATSLQAAPGKGGACTLLTLFRVKIIKYAGGQWGAQRCEVPPPPRHACPHLSSPPEADRDSRASVVWSAAEPQLSPRPRLS